MAGTKGHSGGANRKSEAQHRLEGTYRADRHARSAPEVPPLSTAARRRALHGLRPEARRLLAGLLDEYDGWDAAHVRAARSFALSCERLAALEADPGADTRALHREIRASTALLRLLNLERT